MPNRILKASLRQSHRWNKCDLLSQVFYVRLLMLVDDYGRYEAHSQLLANECFPYGDPSGAPVTCQSIENCLTVICSADLACVYEIDGTRYVYLKRWNERVRTESKFPKPPNDSHMTVKCMSSVVQMLASPPSPSPSPSPSPTPSPARATPTDSARVEEVLKAAGEVSSKLRVPVEPSSKVQADINLTALQRIEERLNQIYKRPPTQRWDCDEEQQLVIVSKRDGVLDEMAHIFYYRGKMPIDDRKRFFPQSVRTLLNNWGSTLDKARVQCPKPNKNPTKSPVTNPNLKPFEPSKKLAEKFRMAALNLT